MKFCTHLVDLLRLRSFSQQWKTWKFRRCIYASYEPFRLSFLAISPSEIVFTVAVPEIKGKLTACGTVLQFFPQIICSSALFKKRAVIWEWGERCRSIFLKSLFHYRKYSTPSVCGTDFLACELLQSVCSLLALWVSDCLQQYKTGKRDEQEDPNRLFSPLSVSCSRPDAQVCTVFGPCLSLWESCPQSCGSDCSLDLCTGCHPSCRTCVGPGASHCLQCRAPEDVLQPHQPMEGAVHGLCLSRCQAWFYVDSTGVCKRE